MKIYFGLESTLKEKIEITTDIVGHEKESKKQIKVLSRFTSVKEVGYTYEPDVRHSEMHTSVGHE